MKIQLDTVNKTIKLEENTNLEEMVAVFEKILPNGEWKKFILETNTFINNWSSPIIIEKYTPWNPYRQPWYVLTSSSSSQDKAYCLNEGKYNLSIEK